MKVTMGDVAKLAKLSRATVSLALRERPEIPEATRLRVRQAAKKLGYVPHPLVSALMATRRKKRTEFQSTLAFLTAYPTRDGWRKTSRGYAALYTGAKARAKALGYALEEFWAHEPGVDGARLTSILKARGIHGIILSPLPAENGELLPLDWSAFSVLAVGYSVRTPGFHRISHDYFHGMSLALQHGRAKGYRKIGLFLDRRVSRVISNLWHAAYLVEQHTSPGAMEIAPLLANRWDDPALISWLKAEQPHALISLDSWRLQEINRVPPTLPLICLNADESPHPLPGIARNFSQIGEAAVDRLVSLLQTNQRGALHRAQTVLIEGEWSHDELLSPAGRSLKK